MRKMIPIPNYMLSEEIINAISHGIGALLSIAALVLMVVSSKVPLETISAVIFGSTMILLYTLSCIYHSLSKRVKGKGVLRILDHCNVYLLVWGTYFPVSLLGINGSLGLFLLLLVSLFSILGIIFTVINVKKYQILSVFCHLICGWSILFGLSHLINNLSWRGTFFLLSGGVFYTIGAILFGVGSKVRYIHCIFHVFCLLGTFFHFWCVYFYIL